MNPNKPDIGFVCLTRFQAVDHPGSQMLGPWCVSINDNTIAQYSNNIKRNALWNYRKNNFEKEIHQLYLKYLTTLADNLNQHHQVQYNRETWELMIGPFLFKYICILYDRFQVINNLVENYNFETTVLNSDICRDRTFVTARDFFINSQSDFSNFYLFSRALVFFKKEFPEVNVEDSNSEAKLKRRFIAKIAEKFVSLINLINISKPVVFFSNSYLEFTTIVRMSLMRKFRVKVFIDPQKVPSVTKNYLLRKKLFRSNENATNVEKFILGNLSSDFPLCYLEGFESCFLCSFKRFGSSPPQAVVSANSIYFDELFKFFLCRVKKNIIYIGIQHGGNYRLIKHFFEEDFERKHSDLYLDWGPATKLRWPSIGGFATKPFMLKKFRKSRLLSPRKNKKANKFLFCMTIKPRFFADPRRLPEERINYFSEQVGLIKQLNQSVLEKLWIRPYFGFERDDIIDLWRRYLPSVQVDNDSSFRRSASSADLIICDHVMTTCFEALGCDIPTMILVNRLFPSGQFGEQVVEDLDRLSDVGIVHYSIESLAAQLNFVHGRLTSWWNEEKLQSMKDEFCGKYVNMKNCPSERLATVIQEVISK